MNLQTSELKNILHESIENIDDEALLQEVRKMLERKYKPEEKITLCSHQEECIKKARKSINRGNYLNNEQADEIAEKWLNK